MTQKTGWAFWPLSRWDGRYTRRHFVQEDGATACGLIPHPEDDETMVFEPDEPDDHCGRCERVLKFRKARK